MILLPINTKSFIINIASTLDDCPNRGGKSGQHRTRWLLTATGGDPRESAAETILLLQLVKGKVKSSAVNVDPMAVTSCGGKPHRLQGVLRHLDWFGRRKMQYPLELQ